MNIEMLNPEQLSAFNGVTTGVKNLLTNYNYKTAKLQDRIFCLSGSSGTGKSTTTSLILKEFQDSEIDVLITSPTHKAKKVIADMCDNVGVSFEATTIHSYLGLKVKNNVETGRQDLIQNYGNNPPSPYSVLIIDEFSMIGKELLDFILAEVEYGTIGCVLFVGDSYQLLGVNEQESAVLSLEGTHQYTLNQVMRQALENPIIEIATMLRDCIISGKYMPNIEIKEIIKERLGEHIEQVPDIKALLNRYFDSEYEIDTRSVIAYKNKTVSMLNKKIRDWEIDSDECFIEGEQLTFNSAMVEDDKVVIGNNELVTLKNLKKIYESSLDINYWKLIDTESRVFRVIDFNDKDDFEYELQEIAKKAKKATGSARSAYWQRFFELKQTYQDVAYTFAGTAFKAQGSSFNEVYIHLDEILGMRTTIGEENLFRAIYVALTRTKDKLIVLMR